MTPNDIDFRQLMEHYEVQIVRDRGRRATAVCPFPDHKDDTPSFSIDFEKKVFNCFGCGRGGGVIKFVKFKENCSDSEAISILQDVFGVQFDKMAPRDVPRAVREQASRMFMLFKRLSFYIPWLKDISYAEVEGPIFDKYVQNKRWKKERDANPGPTLLFMLSGQIDVLLLDIEDAWKKSWPTTVMDALKTAHEERFETIYFMLMDGPAVSKVVTERDLLKEIKRLSILKIERSRPLLLSQNKKKIEAGKQILVGWIGSMKRFLSSGIYENADLILRESFT